MSGLPSRHNKESTIVPVHHNYIHSKILQRKKVVFVMQTILYTGSKLWVQILLTFLLRLNHYAIFTPNSYENFYLHFISILMALQVSLRLFHYHLNGFVKSAITAVYKVSYQ